MKLTVLYDDEKNEKNMCIADHGFSCLIETDEDVVIFDTGTKGQILLHNMKILGKDPSKISHIVISHEHYDHTGGLDELLSNVGKVPVYQVRTDCEDDDEVVMVENPIKICNNVWSTGRLPGSPIDEQSLLLNTKNGLIALVGCAHSGVVNILHAGNELGNMIGLIGGFHGFSNFSIVKDLDLVLPCHCTVHKEKIRRIHPSNIGNCIVGTSIDLEEIS